MHHVTSASQSRPLILRPETVKSACEQDRDDPPAEARAFNDVARNAHPSGDVHEEE